MATYTSSETGAWPADLWPLLLPLLWAAPAWLLLEGIRDAGS